MSTSDPDDVRDTAAQKPAEMRADDEDLIRAVRDSGGSVVQCIKTLVEVRGCSLARAKEVVHHSETWADALQAHEQFNESIEEATRRETSP